MRKRFIAVFLVFLATSFFSSTTRAIEFKKASSSPILENQELSIVMRLIGGKGAILSPGKELKLTFRVNQPGYVIIYNIDSDGFINLIYPHDGRLKKTEKDKVYTLPLRGSNLTLKAGRKTGIEYIHALAVNKKDHIDERELYFLSQNYELPRDKKFRTDMGPYLSFNMIDETIVRDIENNPPACDHTYFFINKKVDYPSYLCGQCHGADKFRDPYDEECAEITIDKNFYEQKVGYPYPPLFNITHYEEAEDNNYYSTTYYEDNLSNNWDDELLSSNDTDIYLTINYWQGWNNYPSYYSGYYYNNYPHWYPSYSYWYPSYSYYDSFYWGFGFNWGYNSWYGYYSPYTWYRPYYQQYNYCWNNFYDGRRSISANRKFTKHPLNYQTASNKIRLDKSLANSRLVKRRITSLKGESRNQSKLSRVLTPQRVTSSRDLTRRNRPSSEKSVIRRTVYGDSQRNNSVRTRPAYKSRTTNRAKEEQRIYKPDTRTTKKRSSTESTRKPVETRPSKSSTGDKNRSAREDNKTRSRPKQSVNSPSRVQNTRKSSPSRSTSRPSSRNSSPPRKSSGSSKRSSSRSRR